MTTDFNVYWAFDSSSFLDACKKSSTRLGQKQKISYRTEIKTVLLIMIDFGISFCKMYKTEQIKFAAGFSSPLLTPSYLIAVADSKLMAVKRRIV